MLRLPVREKLFVVVTLPRIHSPLKPIVPVPATVLFVPLSVTVPAVWVRVPPLTTRLPATVLEPVNDLGLLPPLLNSRLP